MNWLTWMTPTAGLLLAAAVIPPLILLYFLKLRRRPQPMASTLLWKKSIEDLRANAPFQKLRKSLLLFLQLIALALLALAIMQPRLEAGQARGGKTVIMIDNSASMTATDTEDGDTRLEHAKREAIDWIERTYGRGLFGSDAGETMVIAFSDRAEVLARFTRSKQQLISAIRSIRPTHGETLIAKPLELARAYTTNVNPEQAGRVITEPATIELFSDGRIADLADEVLRGEQLIYHPIGGPDADNIGVVTLSVERPWNRPDAVQVFAALLNYNRTPVTCDVQLSVDTIARGIEEVELPAATYDEATGDLVPGRHNVLFTPFPSPGESVIEVALLRPDALSADSVAHVVVPPPRQLRVALVASGSMLIRTVLEGLSLQALDVLAPSEFEGIAATPEALDRYDVIVLDGWAPENLPPARYLICGAVPPLEGLHHYGRSEPQLVIDTRREHPVFQFASLDDVVLSSAALYEPSDEVAVLAEGSDGPLILEIARGPLHALLVAFDPAESNWPFRRSFPTFFQNTVEYLGSLDQALTARGYTAGEALQARLPADARDISMTVPDGSKQEVDPLDPAQFSWGPVRLSGVHLLAWQTADGADHARPFAVNLFSADEGDIATAGEVVLGQERIEGEFNDDGSSTPLWPWAIGACLGVLLLEWWIYHRKAYL